MTSGPAPVTPDHSLVTGYIRVSTGEQQDSGLGLAVQRNAIIAECERKGWTLVDMWEDAETAKSMSRRHGLESAIGQLQSGEAGTLMAYKLDRVFRSVADFATQADDFRRRGWNLSLLDIGLDMTTPNGEFMATVIAAMAQLERRLISQRTKEALAVARERGVKLGRPSRVPVEVVQAMVRAHDDGIGWQRIAEALNADGVPTAQGGAKWYPATVRGIVNTANGIAATR